MTHREVYYVPYLGLTHLRLIRQKFIEEHCIFVEGIVCIKMVSP